MGKKIVMLIIPVCVLVLLVCVFEPAFAVSADSWVTKAAMVHARAYLGVASVNGKIYAIGGDEGSETGNCKTGTSMTNNAVPYTEEYDPALNVWTSKADMPTARALLGTAVYGGKIFCIGGYNGAIGNLNTEYYDVGANEAYDPATDTWLTLAPLPTPRYKAATNMVNGKIYVIGGHTMTNLYITLNVTEVYDPTTNSWTTKTPAPLPVGSYASAVIDNKIYVLGTNPDTNWQMNLMVYDPSTDSWTTKGKTPIGYAATAAATTRCIYYFDENRTDIYDSASDTWSSGTPSPTTRLIAKAAVVDDTIYLIGGRTGQWGYITLMYPTTLNEQYTPFSYGTPDLPTPSPSPASPQPTPLPSESPLLPSSSPEVPSLNNEPAGSTTTVIVVACVVTVAVVGLGLILYLRKSAIR
jgi:N-acetylneuraminic acid mutarotase